LGAVGELFIGGAGVVRGYLNRPELTAERFISSPFLDDDRLFRSGRLGRYRPDGAMELLGHEPGLEGQPGPAPDAAPYEPPEGDIEKTLARIWSELLKVERIGRRDNFFDLGGHSLLAIRMIGRIERAFGVAPRISVLFKYPDIEGLGELIALACEQERASQEN
jgi:acyl-CoA synthetase (AMP-forming)/AMP-acid ligase II